MSLIGKKISPQTLMLLKEALSSIYWRKNDARKFIEYTIENTAIVSTIDWDGNTKYESVSELIDRMVKRDDLYHNDILKLIYEAINFSDFDNLNRWDDSEVKIKKAKDSVEKLRNNSKGYFDKLEELEKTEKAKVENKSKITQTLGYQQKLEDLKTKFFELSKNANHQARGFQLEKFLNELFIFFDLEPKSSFKIAGEQIDGSFTFDNADYLLEAKWQFQSIAPSDLYAFGGKISGKLKNTLGLYISLGSYSEESIKSTNPTVKAIILMDGTDLMQVLDGWIKLNDLLFRKRTHCAQTGEIFYRVTKFI